MTGVTCMVLNYEDCARLLTQRRRIHNISVMMKNKEKNMGIKTTVAKPKTMAEVKEMYPEVLFQDQYIDLSRSGRNKLDKFLELRKQASKLEKEMEAVKVAIAMEIGAYAGADAGDHKVHFPLVSQDRVDTQRLKDDHPELVEDYITVTTFRKFEVRVSPKSEV